MTEAPMARQLLRAHLAANAPAREMLVAKLFIGLTVLALACVLVLAPTSERPRVANNLLLFVPAVAFHLVLLEVLRRGYYRPWVTWLSTLVQVSVFAIPYYALASERGAEFVVGNGLYAGWLMFVSISAVKAAPPISVAAGLVAAGEFLGLSLAFAGDELSAAQRHEVTIKAAMMVVTGAGAGGVASYLIAQAHAALQAVREQDLMGKYFMHERLGAGGMAEVFRATYSPEGGFEKIVAVKRVLPEIAAAAQGAQFVQMFREEAQLCAALSHPNVVQVLDAGRFRDSYVLTMEYVDGVPLHRVMFGRAPIPLAAATFVAAELAAALDYIHNWRDANIVHRDVNPPNVLLSRHGEVKLADFGVAHAVDRASLDKEHVYGKPGYMAPEQLGGTSIDGRADLFALGVTLFEMIANKRLFRSSSLFEVLELRSPEAELAASPHGAAIPAELRRLVVDLLAPSPGDRPRTAGEVRARLLALAGPAAPLPAGRNEVVSLVAAALAEPAPRAERDTTATASTVLSPKGS